MSYKQKHPYLMQIIYVVKFKARQVTGKLKNNVITKVLEFEKVFFKLLASKK